jgi:hypothetical protein
MATNTAATTRLICRARLAETVTIAWMVVELVVALWVAAALPSSTVIPQTGSIAAIVVPPWSVDLRPRGARWRRRRNLVTAAS